MTSTESTVPPIAPDVPLSLPARLRALKYFHVGPARVRDAGGPVAMVRLGPSWLVPPFAIVTSTQGARDVLGTADGAYDKQNLVILETRAVGDNVFNLPHERWLPRRRALQPLFTKRHVAGFGGHMARAAAELSESWAVDRPIDLDRECRTLTLRVVGEAIFGSDLGARAGELAPHIKVVLQWITHRSMRPVRSPAWLPTPARRRFRESVAVIRGVIGEAIEAARRDPSRDAQLIRRLFDTIDPTTGNPLTDEAIRDELFVFVIAGHDTTSTTLCHSLWALGRDSLLQDRVAAEVAAFGDRPLTVDDVEHLTFTVQVIHESLRICPPGPIITRMAMRDVVIDGYRVPAGTNVFVGVYAMHHDPALWDDPERFDPDRFEAARSAARDRWQYVPFGAGQRNCIGSHFAMLEATLGLAAIVRNVEITSTEADFPLALPFTMTAGAPIPATVRVRSSAAA